MRMFSVTEVLKRWSDFEGIAPAVLQTAAERGTEVHRCCSVILCGGKPETSMAGVVSRVNSFIRWWKFHELALVSTERTYADQEYGFYGHPDIVARDVASGLWVIDLKTPAQARKTWNGQMAAYKHLAEREHGVTVQKACAVLLDPEGKIAREKRYDESARDLAVFLSALQATREYTEKGGEQDWEEGNHSNQGRKNE